MDKDEISVEATHQSPVFRIPGRTFHVEKYFSKTPQEAAEGPSNAPRNWPWRPPERPLKGPCRAPGEPLEGPWRGQEAAGGPSKAPERGHEAQGRPQDAPGNPMDEPGGLMSGGSLGGLGVRVLEDRIRRVRGSGLRAAG